jgi:hypothetical protein
MSLSCMTRHGREEARVREVSVAVRGFLVSVWALRFFMDPTVWDGHRHVFHIPNSPVSPAISPRHSGLIKRIVI